MTTPENTEACPDGHQCENGSLCVETNEEGRFACDCDESSVNGATVFSGLYCSHEATVYCTLDGPDAISTTSFCTNDGTCKGSVSKHEEHLGCQCPSSYTGKHCQFVEGSEPEGFVGSTPAALQSASDAANDRGGDGTGLGTPGLVIIIVLAMAFLGAAFAFIVRRRRQHATTHMIETTKSTDGNLPDADGQNLALPTQSFETADGTASNTIGDDDAQITTVDSGHLA